MKNLLLFAAAILTITGSAMADVKIKSRQTMSGQTSENTTYIKGKRQRTEMMNGQMISITQCDLGRDLQLNSSTRTYMINLYDDGTASEPVPVKTGTAAPVTRGGIMYVTTTTKDTGERKQMFGYTARHIIQTIETETSADACLQSKTKMEMDMWVIDAEFYLTCTQNRTYRPYRDGKTGGCQDKVQTKTLGTGKSGYPLWQKMTTFDANGKESYSMIQEVIELSKATLDQSLFEAPADYREVKTAQEMYASANTYSSMSNSSMDVGSTNGASSGMTSSIKAANSTRSDNNTSALGPKQPGTVRVGIAGVKVGSVGEGITAADLGAAIQNSLGEYLKGTRIEVVNVDAKLASAILDEARQKDCDYVVLANASHKKGGGGGFGFGKLLAQTVGQTGIGHTGSVAGNIAGQVATTAIVTAGSMSENVKKKDEVTLELKVQSLTDNSQVAAKQFKAKAQSDGDDIITTVVEQAAQTIVDTVGR